MNVYDFDNTIYNGETVLDFYLFCLKKHPALIKYMPLMFYMLIKYKAGKISLIELESKAAVYSGKIFLLLGDVELLSKEFYETHRHKIKKFYLSQKSSDDIIISASFGFILRNFCQELGINNCLSSEIDTKTGEIIQICYHKNKTHIFKEHFPTIGEFNFYTDSLSDLPMIQLSKKAYLVKGNKIKEIK